MGRTWPEPNTRITNDLPRVRIEIRTPPAKCAIRDDIVVAYTHQKQLLPIRDSVANKMKLDVASVCGSVDIRRTTMF